MKSMSWVKMETPKPNSDWLLNLIASSIDFSCPSMSVQVVFKNALTFSNIKNLGLYLLQKSK